MLYTVLPGLTLCMTLLGNNSSGPQVNVGVDQVKGMDMPHYAKYLDAAMLLIRAAKEMRIKESRTQESLEQSESEIDENADVETTPMPTPTKEDDSKGMDESTACPSKPIDCEEILVECKSTVSGVYRIFPRSRVNSWGDSGFLVFCDMETDRGGWTVFQRRDDFGTNSDFFYKGWQSYKYGFGDLNYDFWLGNDKIFALSNQRSTTVRFDLLDFTNEEGFATYDKFYIDDENEAYRLHLGDYRGNIGDSFSGHHLSKFSTKDRDNDNNRGRSCAQTYKGGWWYNNCHTVNLNGLYHKGTHNTYADGINWHGWRGFKYSLKKTEIKLRSSTFWKPINFENGEETVVPAEE